jgi:MOSC domain-containing protein YiiM
MSTSKSYGSVVAVCKKSEPGLPKLQVDSVELIENYGITGDYHAGRFVRHRYLAEKDPNQPNVRQILLVDTSMLAALYEKDIHLKPGMLGENIIVDGVSVMALPIGTEVEIGETLLEMTEVRNPCYQLNEMHPDLLETVKSEHAGIRHNAGMLARILKGGWIRPGDLVTVRHSLSTS